MGQQTEELKRRISVFSVTVLKFIRRLPRDIATDSVLRQLARAAGGVSSNYRAACCARSRREFVAKIGVALEEADETNHWLWISRELELAPGKEFDAIAAEAREIRQFSHRA